ncbi:kinase-like protein [Ceratobasidium sp. AG-I]|nr:kinase-like protein [Ceratobasidium sp. AG-I]
MKEWVLSVPADFFYRHPWLSTTFRISSSTPLDQILAYFRDVAGIPLITSELMRAKGISSQAIAQGGLADIYRATLEDGSQVAVKRLRQHPESNRKDLKRTARELDTWSKLDHPNILQLFGLAEFHGGLSMVSPWMEYGNVVSALSKWPTVDRYALCAQLVDAIAYLHGPEVAAIHGDIKGENVLIDGEGHVKLTDFGLAIMHDQSMRFSETDPGGGTIRWMAPELFMEEGARCRETDVYALGMEIMTGRIPFSEIQFGPVVIKAVTQDRRIPDVSELQTIPLSPRATLILAILLRCWRYEPDKRITAEEIQTMMGFLGPP